MLGRWLVPGICAVATAWILCAGAGAQPAKAKARPPVATKTVVLDVTGMH
jgi:hypothetical protein